MALFYRQFDPRVAPDPNLYEIDWTHPLAAGLIACWIAGNGGVDLCGNAPVLDPTQSKYRFTSRGLGYSGGRIGNSTTSITIPPIFRTGTMISQCTIFSIGEFFNAANGQGTIGITDLTGTGNVFPNLVLGAGNLTYNYNTGGPNTGGGINTSTTYPPNGAAFSVAGSHTVNSAYTGNAQIYCNGQMITQSGSGGTAAVYGTTGAMGPNISGSLSVLNLSLIYNIEKTAAQIQWLHNEPFIFLKPRSPVQYYIPPPPVAFSDTVSVSDSFKPANGAGTPFAFVGGHFGLGAGVSGGWYDTSGNYWWINSSQSMYENTNYVPNGGGTLAICYIAGTVYAWDGTNWYSYNTTSQTFTTVTLPHFPAPPLSDTVSVSDQYSANVVLTASFSDTVAVSDGFTVSLLPLSLSDTVSVSDQYSANVLITTYNLSFSDTVVVSDGFSETVIANAALTDTLTVSETLTQTAAMPAVLSDTVAVSDQFTEAMSGSASLSDVVSVSDQFSETLTAIAALSDNVAVSETMAAAMTGSAFLSDSVSVSDIVSETMSATASLTDSVSVSESLSAAMSGSASLTDSLIVSDTMTETTVSVGVMADIVSVSDQFTEAMSGSAALADTVAVSEQWSAASGGTYTIALTDSVGVIDGFTAALAPVAESLSDSVVVSEALSGNLIANYTLSDSLTVSEQLSATLHPVALSLSDTVVVSEVWSVVLLPVALSLSDSVVVSDALAGSMQANAVLADSVAVSDVFGASTNSNAVVSFSDNVVVVDFVSAVGHANASLTDTITVSEQYTPAFGATCSFADIITQTESWSCVVLSAAQFADVVSVSDQFITSLQIVFPAGRLISVASDNRVLSVPADIRSLVVSADVRVITINT